MSLEGRAAPVVLLTGLSGAGKTALARGCADRLRADGFAVEVLDGDDLRAGISRDLGFSSQDRAEHLRRAGCAAARAAASGTIVLMALIAPSAAARRELQASIGTLLVVHVCTGLDICMQRDPKGLYARSRAGLLTGLSGIDAPYDVPESPALRLDAGRIPLGEGIAALTGLVLGSLLGTTPGAASSPDPRPLVAGA